jgi:hypothetical protein
MALSGRPDSPGTTKQGFLLAEGVKQVGGPLIDAIRDRHFVFAHQILDEEPWRVQQEVGVYGLTPLHWCGYQGRVIPFDLVVRVLNLNLKAVYKVDAKRRLPLHYAFCNSTGTAREEVVSLLLRHYPFGAIMPDETGTRPLDYANRTHESLAMLQMLMLSTFSNGLYGGFPVSKRARARLFVCRLSRTSRTAVAAATHASAHHYDDPRVFRAVDSAAV